MKHSVKSKLINERGWLCENCLNTKWLGKPIPLEVHHIEKNCDDKENLQLLCCNCHALTPNYRGKGIRTAKTVSDEEYRKLAIESNNVRELLSKLNLVAKGGNYEVARKRLATLGLSDKFAPSFSLSPKICPACQVEFWNKKSKCCSVACANAYNQNGTKTRKIKNRPDKEIIKLIVNNVGYSATGRIFGVSDNAVRKWIR
jgi:hypothetical protein